MTKTICIDARFYGIRDTGIGRYVENLISNLPPDPRVKIVLIVRADNFNSPELMSYKKYVVRHHPYSPLSQFEMVSLLAQIKPDLVHFTQFAVPVLWPGKYVVTIHDLIKHMSRGSDTTTHNPFFYWIKYLGYLLVSRLAIHRASHIIVPALFWKTELTKRFRIPENKISVTYEAVSDFFSSDKSSRPKGEIKTPYVVYTGNLYPHKNVTTAIDAVDKLGGQLSFYVVCARSIFADRLPKSPNTYFLGRLPDPELLWVYQHATAFVFPSLVEGFGLPGLEAMAAGCPVIAARASCLPEIYGDSALYFEPLDSTGLSQKINSLITDTNLRKNLIAKGHEKVNSYSWVKMSKQTWAIYQDALR